MIKGRSIYVLLDELKRCRSLERGKQLYSQVMDAGLRPSSHSAILLLNLYSKCGFIDEARFIFDRLPCHGVVSWTLLISGYTENGRPDLALELFSSCLQASRGKWEPNARTFVAALTACSMLLDRSKLVKTECLEKARWIHSQAKSKGCDHDLFVANTLVALYAKCGSLIESRGVFDRMKTRCIVSWTALMLAFAENGDGEMAMKLYSRVLLEGLGLDGRVFVAALMACGILAALEDGLELPSNGSVVKLKSLGRTMAIHDQASITGHLFDDIFVANALIDAYSKCGTMADATRVFGSMQCHDVVSWTSLILGFVEAGEMELALQTFDLMKVGRLCVPNARTFVAVLKACSCMGKDDGERLKFLEKGREIHLEASSRGCDTDIYVATTLVAMYASCGSLSQARSIFESIASRSIVSWNVMIAGCVENGENLEALELLQRMKKNNGLIIRPSAQTFIAALEACAASTSFGAGVELHGEICRAGMEDEHCVATSLVNFYGKCGNVIKAQQAFDSLSSRKIDTAAWSSLIAGYSRLGDAGKALTLFEKMKDEGTKMDNTLILEVLMACSHAGLVDRGKNYFAFFGEDHRVCLGIEHYNCLVDMLGRANRLDEAMAVVKSMPLGVNPNLMTWRTVLAACKKWNNVEMGKEAFDCLMRMDEREAASYVIMANLHTIT
ncbi:pentatricopeptide repeat-containing protein At4g18520, chloroplastic-like [Selaginella moellendorffii]|uniref:pentatricopeptide repeat-containing protein At4g18520, chloroplastic-like n=1 Tax=Selaginella moellendorffii TaxID=88036 RepID=UPI000D1C9E88|nr:pentatricopeptide repeat-containing protein At4g18520, chloroplastic-like [Selaginella moellendorffii]|eukprot:XP_024517065.1 pentatricopeptide repeat-containing protein At4g18520, chloroplastic-like [Selaginella moellendorffii]